MTSPPGRGASARSAGAAGSDAPRSQLRVVVLGGGTVGAQVVRLMAEQAEDLTARSGVGLLVTGVGVRDVTRPRPGVPNELLTADVQALVASGPDIVVELIGGIEPARSLILSAMAGGASVVTANKALVATHGAQLHAAAAANNVDLYYEAAVAGAIPLLRPLRESLAGDHIRRVLGIVNGTTNYILTQMDEQGAEFADALRAAQQLGYAEADPTADVTGLDAAAKAAILAGMAFHTEVSLDDVTVEGITAVSAEDMAAARELGFVIKLLAVADLIEQDGGPGVCVRVHPTMVARNHPLAGVRESFNAVFIEADAAGQVMFYGRGAGGEPTASAVLGDVVTAARNRLAGVTGPGASAYTGLPTLPASAASTAYAINLRVSDQPGVLAAVAGVFADHGVSIQSLRQVTLVDCAGLLLLTHEAKEAQLAATVNQLRALPSVRSVVGCMRVIGAAR